jgi:hypothetical protein
MDKTVLLRWFAGNISPRGLKVHFIALIGITMALLTMAGVFYAMRNSFSLLYTQISPLGSHEENPWGWPWFSAAMWFLGVGSIPILNLYRKALDILNFKAKIIINLLFTLTIPSIIMIGFIPPNLDILFHRIFAALVFGGFGFGFLFMGIEHINRNRKNTGDRPSTRLTVQFVAFICFIGACIVSQGYGMLVGSYPAEGTWYAWALWEWLIFTGILIMFVLTSMPFLELARQNLDQHETHENL